jgi:hypothetical protein
VTGPKQCLALLSVVGGFRRAQWLGTIEVDRRNAIGLVLIHLLKLLLVDWWPVADEDPSASQPPHP